MAGVIENLLVYPETMKANLDKLGGLVFSQRVLLALTQAGVSREDSYLLVQRNAMRVWEEGADFLTLLKGDPDVGARLSDEALTECFDPGYHTKHLGVIFERVFDSAD
jgi:adenylosuccinate lyase